MTWRAAEARELRELVHRSGKVLMVGHLLRFHPGVEKLRALIDSGELGDIRYVYGTRVNLGVIRAEENVLWSLGVHDISVVLHLIDSRPVEVSARGSAHSSGRASRTSCSPTSSSSRARSATCTCRGSTRTRCAR